MTLFRLQLCMTVVKCSVCYCSELGTCIILFRHCSCFFFFFPRCFPVVCFVFHSLNRLCWYRCVTTNVLTMVRSDGSITAEQYANSVGSTPYRFAKFGDFSNRSVNLHPFKRCRNTLISTSDNTLVDL